LVGAGGRYAEQSGTADDSRLFIVKIEDGLPVRGPDWISVTEEHGCRQTSLIAGRQYTIFCFES